MIRLPVNTLPKGEVTPYYQPILSLQTLSIIGYEALGRELWNGEARSLGPFFHNPAVPQELQIAVDRQLRERAFRRVVETGYTGLLFFNLKPGWIYQVYRQTGTLPTLQLVDQTGIPAAQLVLEITEEAFSGELNELKEIVELYRSRGCRIAVDDVGSGFSSLDRIAVIQPDIIKMDLKMVRKSAVHDGYKALLRSFSIIAEQIGSSLLVEGVETVRDLSLAIETGARYVQGFLFSQAQPRFQEQGAYQGLLMEELGKYREESYSFHRRLQEVEMTLRDLAAGMVSARQLELPNMDILVEQILHAVPDHGLRVYVCGEDGIQLSSNYIRREDGQWERDESFRGSNWLWRPYFVRNVVHMQKQRSGMLSQAYTDLDTPRLIQTYSCPVSQGCYLFVDLVIR